MKKQMLGIILVIYIFFIHCSGPQWPNIPDPRVLILHGQYNKALNAAQRWAAYSPGDAGKLVMVAVARAALLAPQGSVSEVINDLNQAMTATSQIEVIKLFIEESLGVSAFEQPERFVFLANVLNEISNNMPQQEIEKRRLGTHLLEALAYGAENGVSSSNLSILWQKILSILGNNLDFSHSEIETAWLCYLSAARLALAVSDEQLKLSSANLAITIIESNPELAIAARCDLASPYERLANALYWQREIKARLERAVESATGCDPGTYAPTISH